ncbi:MAG: hypothetical protein GC164_00985 [Phycisphaera sp.]|nr:hypothetical protein [Phycisphaera sp.]
MSNSFDLYYAAEVLTHVLRSWVAYTKALTDSEANGATDEALTALMDRTKDAEESVTSDIDEWLNAGNTGVTRARIHRELKVIRVWLLTRKDSTFPEPDVKAAIDYLGLAVDMLRQTAKEATTSTPAKSEPTTTKGKRPKQGDEIWRDAQDKLLTMLDDGKLDKVNIKEAAALVGHKYGTTRTAIHNSEPLRKHFGIELKTDLADLATLTAGGLDYLSQSYRERVERYNAQTARLTSDEDKNRRGAALEKALAGVRDATPERRADALELLDMVLTADDEPPARHTSIDGDEQDAGDDDYIPTGGRKRDGTNKWRD